MDIKGKQFLQKNIFAGFILTVLLAPCPSFASPAVGTIQAPDQYAWSENAGYVNFLTDYGDVLIASSSLSGYIWDSVYGWTNLSPDNGGVQNDGNGNLSGSAWNQGAGWIDFAGVAIDSNGKFTGTASGLLYGQINFDCDNCSVITDWRPEDVDNSSDDIIAESTTSSNRSSGSRLRRYLMGLIGLGYTETQTAPVAKEPADIKELVDIKETVEPNYGSNATTTYNKSTTSAEKSESVVKDEASDESHQSTQKIGFSQKMYMFISDVLNKLRVFMGNIFKNIDNSI